MRVGCRFAGEVAGIELLEGGVEVVEVERDECHDPLVGVDLNDVEDSMTNSSGRWSRPEEGTRVRARRSPRVAKTVGVKFVIQRSAMARMSAIIGISTRSDSGAHDSTAIVKEKSSASICGHGVPVARCKARQEALVHLACRIFQTRRCG